MQGGLWWLISDTSYHGALLRLVRVVTLTGTLVGLEGRVLLPAFGHYLGLHYPWNYLAISAALFGGGSLLLLHFEGHTYALCFLLQRWLDALKFMLLHFDCCTHILCFLWQMWLDALEFMLLHFDCMYTRLVLSVANMAACS